MINIRSILVIGLAVGLVALAPKALAVDGTTTTETEAQTTPTATTLTSADKERLRISVSNMTGDRTVAGDEIKTLAKERLEAAKVDVCQKRETVIKNTMSRMVDRGTKHIEVLNKISERIQEFYASKGLTIANYNTLIASVVDAKAAAEAAIKQTGDQKETFSCDGYSPKTAAQNFVTSNHAQIDAIKAYHDAIVELLKAVKTAVESTKVTPTQTQTQGASN